MGTLQSYQLQKIKDEIVLNRTWKFRTSAPYTRQLKLSLIELRKLRIYFMDKKLNCFTCNEINLDFEKGYVNCFRDKRHHIELITDDPHLFCRVVGIKREPNTVTYQNYYYCVRCDVYYKKTESNCICCNNRLRHGTHRKGKNIIELPRN